MEHDKGHKTHVSSPAGGQRGPSLAPQEAETKRPRFVVSELKSYKNAVKTGRGLVDVLVIPPEGNPYIDSQDVINIGMDHKDNNQLIWDNLDIMPDLRKDFESSQTWSLRELFWIPAVNIYDENSDDGKAHWLVCMTHDDTRPVNNHNANQGRKLHGPVFACNTTGRRYRDAAHRKAHQPLNERYTSFEFAKIEQAIVRDYPTDESELFGEVNHHGRHGPVTEKVKRAREAYSEISNIVSSASNHHREVPWKSRF